MRRKGMNEMKELTGQRMKTGHWRIFRIFLLTFVILCFSVVSFTGYCFAEEPKKEALEGEGTLSPPSKDSGESIFGSAVSEIPEVDEDMEVILSIVEEDLPVNNGSWSVFICDLEKNSEGSISSRRMQAASLIKLYIMGAVYEDYENLIQKYDQKNIDSNLNAMITVSDNNSANTLVECLGGGNSDQGMAAVNDFCMRNGYTGTSMGRLLLQSNDKGDNYTTVEDCGHFMKAVYAGDSQEYVHANDMFNLLKEQKRRNKIPAEMPQNVGVANKTGELSNVENDAGIIYGTSNDLILVFMSENLSDTASAQKMISSESKMIYEFYCE